MADPMLNGLNVSPTASRLPGPLPGPDSDSGQAMALASARRAERKRARVHAVAPERDEAFEHLSLRELRDERKRLSDEEGRVSYWRRILQARIDLMVSGSVGSGATVDGINRVLNEHAGGVRRTAYLPVLPTAGLAPLPQLPALWQRLADLDNDELGLLAALRSAESELSSHRSALHRSIDTLTAQLIARYRDDPTLALTALPRRVRPPEQL